MTLSLLFYSLFTPFSKIFTTVLTRKDKGVLVSLYFQKKCFQCSPSCMRWGPLQMVFIILRLFLVEEFYVVIINWYWMWTYVFCVFMLFWKWDKSYCSWSFSMLWNKVNLVFILFLCFWTWLQVYASISREIIW